MRAFPFLVISNVLFVCVTARGGNVDYASDAYIKSHFFYGETAQISMIQKEAIPNLPHEQPCSADVIPAAPAQYGKQYFVDAVIRFSDPSVILTEGKKPPKIPAMEKEGINTNQFMCKKENESRGVNQKTGTRWCILPRVGRYILISDSFLDSCGNYFRGFWESATVMDSYVHGKPQYTSMDEHSVTTSLGRYDAMEPDPNFPSAYRAVPGPTGEISVLRFLFFQKATAKDLRAIKGQVEQQIAPNGPFYRCTNGLFQLNPEHCPKHGQIH